MRSMTCCIRHRAVAFSMLTLFALIAVPVFAGEAVLEENIVYGKGGDVDLQLDLARPAEGEGPFPAIVFIHGGGWQAGNRFGYKNDIQKAARRGYVAITVTYRLTEPDPSGKAKHPFPAQIHDVKAAIRWLRANAEKYHVDPERIGATGASAGGHLSLLVGTSDAKSGLEGEGGHADQSSRVQAVVNYFGPTAMARFHETTDKAQGLAETFLGGTPNEQPEAYKLASPITFVSKDDPPTLTLHGTEDKLVPTEQATLFDKALRDAGGMHTLQLLEGQGHGFKGEAKSQAEDATFEFFDQHLKNK